MEAKLGLLYDLVENLLLWGTNAMRTRRIILIPNRKTSADSHFSVGFVRTEVDVSGPHLAGLEGFKVKHILCSDTQYNVRAALCPFEWESVSDIPKSLI
jgi:hypothetical protein